MESQKQHKRRGTPDCQISFIFSKGKTQPKKAPHYHPDLELVYIYSGEVVYWVDGQELTLFTKDILILAPGQSHLRISSSESSNMWSFVFPPEFLGIQDGHVFQEEFVKPLRNGLLELPQLLREGHPAHEQVLLALQWLPYCRNMLKPNYKALRYAMAVSICAALLPWCNRTEIARSIVDSDNTAVQQTMYFIFRNHLRPITLQDIADYVHLHPNYLCALVKKHTGQTVMYHLDKTRVDTATFLLETNQLTMAQIAELSGYNSENMFFYKFKKITGKTPSQWRQDMLADDTHRDSQ